MLRSPPPRRLLDRSLLLLAAATALGPFALAARLGGGGATMLIPFGSQAAAALPSRALDGHARVYGAGLFPGSLVIRRDDDRAPPLWRDGVLALEVPLVGCGGQAGA